MILLKLNLAHLNMAPAGVSTVVKQPHHLVDISFKTPTRMTPTTAKDDAGPDCVSLVDADIACRLLAHVARLCTCAL